MHPRGVPSYVDFLQRAFSAVEEFRYEREGIVMHARVRIGDGAIEMGDAQSQAEPEPIAIYLYVADCDALYAQAVAAGATPLFPPTVQSYGDRMGAVRDAMGTTWYIARPA
jgi:PhnB protein